MFDLSATLNQEVNVAEPSSGWGFKAGLSAAVLGVIVAALWSSLTPLWNWIQTAFSASLSHLAAPSFWPNWVVYLCAGISLLTILCLGTLWITEARQEYKAFRQFDFRGAVWRWYYSAGGPHGIWCYCGQCDGTLVYRPEGDGFYDVRRTSFYCEHCQQQVTAFDGTQSDVTAMVRREIMRQIRTGEWKQHVPTAKKT